MDRRFFLLSASGAVAVPGAAYGPASSGAAPDPLFADWMGGFIDRAAGQGWSRDQLLATFAGLTADPRVIAADSRQPELSKPVSAYIQGAVSDTRVQEGRTRREGAAPWLDPAAARYGVPADILVAIWGMESSFGRIQGDMDVVRSLATLAAEGRRKSWAEGQLLAALRILYTSQATRGQLKGSWAGAMGQTQFTPQDYLDFAVDGDGDGRRDIWGSSADALSSTANFMQRKAAWRPGEAWTREVILPSGFDYGLSEGVRQTTSAWSTLGVRPADGAPWRPADAAEAAQLLLPAGWTGPALLAFPNHFAIRAYNNSMSYALAVGFLAERISGAPPLARPWPVEQPIGRADRIAAQEALQHLGYDVGDVDGVLGLKTRQAARQWQKSKGLPADGYLTYGLIQQLKADGGVSADVPPPPPPTPSAQLPSAQAAPRGNRIARLTA
jgi:membrane-bound lytic murein transglycosylase B